MNEIVDESIDKHNFGGEASWLISHVGSLRRMLPPFVMVASLLTDRVQTDLNKFISLHAEDKVEDNGEVTQYTIPVDHVTGYRNLRRRQDDSGIFMTLLPKMSLVSLVSLYDVYLAQLVRGMFVAKPELLSGSNRQLTYSDLSEFASIDEARSFIVEQEIEALLRDSHTSQFEWLESKLGITLRKDLDIWPTFVEVTERRNLFVHSNGVVNSQYLTICKKSGVTHADDCCLGSTLSVSPEYFSTACNAVAEIGLKLNQVIWRKLLPNEIQEADTSLIQVSYELLQQREFKLAEVVLRFGTGHPIRHASDENKLYLKINLIIALKSLKEHDECNRLLDEVDWTALSDLFKLASTALRDDFDEAAVIMRRIGDSGKPDKTAYRDWPLFKWFRKSDQFKQAYEDIFGEVYRVRRTDKHDEDSPDPTDSDAPKNRETPKLAQATVDEGVIDSA